MVSTRPLISKSPSPWTNPFMTEPGVPVTTDITVIIIFHSFGFFFPLLRQGQGTYLFFRFTSILLCGQPEQQSPQFGLFTFFFSWLSLGQVVWPRFDYLFITQNPKEFCLIFPDGFQVVTYYLFVWSNLNFLHTSQWITSPTLLCLVLYSLCANLLHSFIIIIISLSVSFSQQHKLVVFHWC